jgi:hypothetical protein
MCLQNVVFISLIFRVYLEFIQVISSVIGQVNESAQKACQWYLMGGHKSIVGRKL